ncbi:MAG TPA: dihydrolipoyl dehydrogenase [Candidatus Latescibacteria bacterium]|jgi:dihydrolipoamide dehydrogenase|nr:dihydrolipoyl dehydrogenase [Gemmatimonadaceae bacterium]MDP6016689.1 dihydrolipoyl dehydrogenase [Candidatus Latescibacterota bacterium]HJP32072.1 dihydrolipoyl dehydrogenase [Candidatus Latescibacterota bacterium]
MAADQTQIAVIGGGPGGYVAAFRAADLGLDVTLIDLDENPGGVCLYRGCIPSKALLHVAKLLNETKEAAEWGVTFGEPRIDLDGLRAFKDRVVARMTGGLGQLSKARKVTYVRGRARFTGAQSLKIDLHDGGQQDLSFEQAVLATGSRPVVLPAFDIGSERVMDSTGALELRDVPGRLLVVGGGIIGLELGQVYAALGSQVSVVEMTDGLIPPADRDLVKVLSRRLESQFEGVHLNTKVTAVAENGNALDVSWEPVTGGDGATQTFDRILLSIGRRPNTEDLGLETTRIQLTERGFVSVDAQRRTAEPSIFAIGDVIGSALAHTASHEGIVAAEVMSGERSAFEPNAIPGVVYTDPEIAWCGLTESEAAGRDIKVARFPWAASGRATTLGRSDGLTKLIVDPQTERILGVGIAGPGAGELIAEGVLAVEMAALVQDVALTIHPHPSLSETVMEAAEAYHGLSPHITGPRR